MKPRWIQALELTSQGLTIKQVSDRMGVSVQMVNVHLMRARYKLGSKSTTEAACKAVRKGLICLLIGTLSGNELGMSFISSDVGANPYAPMSDIELFRRAKTKRRRDDVVCRDDITLV